MIKFTHNLASATDFCVVICDYLNCSFPNQLIVQLPAKSPALNPSGLYYRVIQELFKNYDEEYVIGWEWSGIGQKSLN